MQMTPRRLSAFNPLSYPIWLKLIIGFSAAILLIILPASFFISQGVEVVSLQNASSFLSENGARQLSNVTNTFERARTNVERFIDDPINNRVLVSLVLGDVRSGIDLGLQTTNASDVNDLLEATLLNPATSLYENVRLIDRDGQVLAQAGVTLSGISLVDQSETSAYQAVISAADDQNGLLVVSVRGFPVIEFVHKLRWRDGSVIGYLISQVSNSRVIYSNLRFRYTEGDEFRAFSFIVDTQNIIVSPIESRDLAQSSLESTSVRRALGGQSGLDTYTIDLLGTGQSDEILGYYAPIAGTPFVLVAATSVAEARETIFDLFPVARFILVVGSVSLVIVLALLFNQMLTPPLVRLRRAALGLINGDYESPLPDVARRDEIGDAANAFAQMRTRMRSVVDELEGRVALRTRDIQITQEISRFAASQRDAQVLMDTVVRLIIERFPVLYHAQIFLNDAENRYSVVRASTGDVGKQLLERGHRLAVGSVSVIGQVTDQGRYILAKDTAVSQVHRRNEFLPETRSELAIPLRVGDRVIGALDVQSQQSDAFPEDLIRVLETMSDNIAIAIENARLYEESLRRVREIEDSNREATLRVWQEYMRDQRTLTLTQEAGIVTPVNDSISGLRQRALTSGDIVTGELTERNTYPIAVPIQLRGQTLGAVEWEIPANDLTRDKLELARELANRLALSLDNARLFQESRRATERERLVNNIAARLTAQTNIDQILQTAVKEVGQALRSPQVTVRLTSTRVGTPEHGGSNGIQTDRPNGDSAEPGYNDG